MPAVKLRYSLINFTFLFFVYLFVFSYKELVDKFNVEYIPGGATQNSIRVAQVCSIHSRKGVFKDTISVPTRQIETVYLVTKIIFSRVIP